MCKTYFNSWYRCAIDTALTALFRSSLQARLLGLVFLSGKDAWTTRELADRLDVTSISVHRELLRALKAGLVVRDSVGRTFLYRAATDSPVYEPLRLLLERTVGVEAQLRRALEDVAGVETAFIYGSFAEGTDIRPTSDVDVVVLGQPDPHLLRRRLRDVERRIGREIDLLSYAPEELAQLAARGNSLARRIVRGPKKPLVGSSDALSAS